MVYSSKPKADDGHDVKTALGVAEHGTDQVHPGGTAVVTRRACTRERVQKLHMKVRDLLSPPTRLDTLMGTDSPSEPRAGMCAAALRTSACATSRPAG